MSPLVVEHIGDNCRRLNDGVGRSRRCRRSLQVQGEFFERSWFHKWWLLLGFKRNRDENDWRRVQELIQAQKHVALVFIVEVRPIFKKDHIVHGMSLGFVTRTMTSMAHKVVAFRMTTKECRPIRRHSTESTTRSQDHLETCMHRW